MSDAPIDPAPMSPGKAIGYAIGLPLTLLVLLFWPAGDLGWRPGWVFVGVMVAAFGASAAWLAHANPAIFRARSRFQPGTKGWDLALLALLLPMMVAILPVSALDAGRFGWSHMPLPFMALGYMMMIVGIAVTAWAQTVNPFFEPGVRIQEERHQRVIDTGPYRYVRHPGYSAALILLAGMALALGSWWALVPAAIAGALLAVRTAWEDALLHAELPGYPDYARRVRFRLIPPLW